MGNWISDQLIDSWVSQLKHFLQAQKVDFDPNQDNQRIAITFLSWQKKKISSKPRKVLKPESFECPPNLHLAISQIEQNFLSGKDVNGYLSRNSKLSSKHDYLLYDWGIHHLHFDDVYYSGLTKKQRSSELLFLRVTDSTVYFLAVSDHQAFAELGLLEILNENWPEVTNQFKLVGDFEASVSLTAKDRQRLRSAKLNVMPALKDGKALMTLMMGGGIASSGDSVAAVDEALIILRRFDLVGDYLEHCFSDPENPINCLFGQHSEFQLCQAIDLIGDATYWSIIDAVTNIGATFDSILNLAYIWESEGIQRNAK